MKLSGCVAVMVKAFLFVSLLMETSTFANKRHFVGTRDSSSREGNGYFISVSENGTETLESVLQNVASHTIILLESGRHTIEDFILVENVTNIKLQGQKSIIQCAKDTGLAFVNVSNLSFRNISVDGCGFNGSHIDKVVSRMNDIVNLFYQVPRVVHISLFLGHCENLTMEHVAIINTRGFGVVGINIIGVSQLTDVLFFNNTNPGTCNFLPVQLDGEYIEFETRYNLGGAVALLYFDYCPALQPIYRGRYFRFNLRSCNFTSNGECSLIFLNQQRSPGFGDSLFIESIGYRLGGSAGLALVLAQLDYGIDVNISSSVFNKNTATAGGASNIAMFMGVRNTHVVFEDCLFLRNRGAVVFFNDLRGSLSEGTENSGLDRNASLSVLRTNFSSNQATVGSAMFVHSNYYSAINNKNEAVKVFIDACSFVENSAVIGSAVVIYEYKINGFAVGMQISIRDTNFINNEIVTADTGAAVTISQSAGILDVRNVNLTLHGRCLFRDNTGTALRAESSVIGINGNITFLRNTGINGGALHLVIYSYIVMNRNSSIYFIENAARIEGGAIYVNENGLNSYLVFRYQDCFIHFAYDNFFTCENCSDLNSYGVYIKFSNNTANSGSMVSGSSLATCPWAENLLHNDETNRSVFDILNQDFPNVFDFDRPPNDSSLIRSSADRLVVEDQDNVYRDVNSNVTSAFPGEVFHINISAVDDFNQTISNVIAAFASSAISEENKGVVIPFLSSNAFAVLVDNEPTTVPVRVFGMENQTINLIIYSTDVAGRAQVQIDINLLTCGFGFVFDVKEQICTCDSRLEEMGITCNIETQEIAVPDGIWIGWFGVDDPDIVVHYCIFRYCLPGVQQISITADQMSIEFDVQCDPSMNRIGLLCSRCKEGSSAMLGSRRCRECSDWYIVLFPIFLVIGVVAVILLLSLRMTITAGFINGAIFYSNIVSLYGSSIVPGDSLLNGPVALVSFLTLNLGFETCLHNGMNDLEKVWWQLSYPFYLFILMAITTLLARTKYLKFNRSTGLGTIQAFATLLILCYVSVLEFCSEMVVLVSINALDRRHYLGWKGDPSIPYFGKEHAVLGVLAFLLLLVYVIPLPLFLLFPRILYSGRYLSKLKPLYDAFWDPYKPRYRFFLGLRLMFRWIPFGLAVFTSTPLNLFVTTFFLIVLLGVQFVVQPFRQKWVNSLDAIFICNLLLLFSGSLYFWAGYNSSRDEASSANVRNSAYIYSSILIVVGFLTMLGILLYHIIVRFPKLKDLTNRLLKKSSEKVVNPAHTPTEQGTQEDNSGGSNEALSPTCAMELREPLLESGSAHLYYIDPSNVPPHTS